MSAPVRPGDRGASPRARGSRMLAARPQRAAGRIPAGAGEPRGPPRSGPGPAAHPRGRGGACLRHLPGEVGAGASPRARGSPRHARWDREDARRIPAGAGEPRARLLRNRWMEAHPRGRGGAVHSLGSLRCRRGASPRARGSRRVPAVWACRHGRIPAGAGEPSGCRLISPQRAAHPRGRGGAVEDGSRSGHAAGASPRARGSQHLADVRGGLVRRIPAGAGEPRANPRSPRRRRAHPRGRGGAAESSATPAGRHGASPRARGSHLVARSDPLRRGRIPAGAGEPGRCGARGARGEAHPRGRGGAAVLASIMASGPRRIPAGAGEPNTYAVGSAELKAHPRGRGGAAPAPRLACRSAGRIPAGAGEPADSIR